MATFPPIQTAIKRSGGDGGMRIQLDIPESEMANAVALLAFTQKVLKVTVEVEDGDDSASGRRQAKRRE
jgi:hypothetical protein